MEPTRKEADRKGKKQPLDFSQAQHRFKVQDVTVDGISYKSDRFYLNVAAGETYEHGTNRCHCGSQNCNPPPLFDREKLLKELLGKSELEAVIMGTFSVGLGWMSQRFPELVGPNASIPTLILHGTKGLTKRLKQAEPHDIGETIDPESEEQEICDPIDHVPHFNFPSSFDDDELSGFSSDADVQSLVTQECFLSSPARKLNSPSRRPPQFSMTSLGQNFHLTEVLPTCDGSTPGVTQEKNHKNSRQRKFGVHHPKFMLLFEKSGDLIVVVSTANLVSTKTVEGSWIQRFRRRNSKPNSRFRPNNDFGSTLQDFLRKLSDAGEDGHMTVGDFLSKYMKFKLKDLSTSFHFEKATVHLIPTIPGSFRSDSYSYRKYGRHRVETILSSVRDMPQMPQDSLIIQPTSLGSHLTVRNLAHIGKSYLGCSPSEGNYKVLDRLTIVWPSQQFIANACHSGQSQLEAKLPILNVSKDMGRKETARSGFVFLSAEGFNSCDMDCVCRLAHYELSKPFQRSQSLIPHIKSIARICRKYKRFERRGQECFSWFLLTSACLSLGAQGKLENTGSGSTETVTYTNFELGVLFTSERVEKSTGRLYCFRPNECCNQLNYLRSNLVHLPVPYSLEPRQYMEGNEEKMNAMPFFHQIMHMDFGGNFMCTPHECLARPMLQPKEANSEAASIAKKARMSV